MSTTSPVNGWTLPALGDPADIVTAVQNPLNSVDARVNPIFTTTGARDSAISAPAQGQECYVTATGEKYIYNGSVWVGLKPKFYRKNSNQSVTDSVTLVDATSLGISVEANSSYIFKGDLIISSVGTTGNDMQVVFTVPASVTGNWSPHAQADTASSPTGGIYLGNINLTTNVTLGTLSANDQRIPVSGHIVTGATSGTVQLQFAEAAAVGGVTSVVIGSGSYFEVWKVA